MTIDEVMNREVFTCGPDDSLALTAQLMWKHDIGSVAVVDSTGKPVGMITDRDVCMSAYFTGKPLTEQTVALAMSRELFTARLGESVQNVEALMRSKQVRRVPVVDRAGKLAGIVTVDDLALTAGKSRSVKPEEVTMIMAAVCQPRHPPYS